MRDCIQTGAETPAQSVGNGRIVQRSASPALEMHLVELLSRAAGQAPSAENHLVYESIWRTDPPHLELRATGAYHQHLTPQLRFLADISAGAMAENIRCLAAYHGVGLACSWSTGDVRARLHPGSGEIADGLAHAIPARCTNRRPYATAPLSLPIREQLLEAGHGIPDIRTTILAGSAKDLFAEAAAVAEGARLRSRQLHGEMYAGIRFDVGWNASTTVGIPPGSLEVERMARAGFTAMRSWWICRTIAAMGGAAGFGWRSGRFLVDRSAAVILLDCPLAPDQAAPLIGLAMQRVWLQATSLGLAVQPMPAAALFVLPWWQGVPPAARTRLGGLWQRILPGRTPLMALRVGYAPAPTIRAGRSA